MEETVEVKTKAKSSNKKRGRGRPRSEPKTVVSKGVRGRPRSEHKTVFERISVSHQTLVEWRQMRANISPYWTDNDLAVHLMNYYKERNQTTFDLVVGTQRFGLPAVESTPHGRRRSPMDILISPGAESLFQPARPSVTRHVPYRTPANLDSPAESESTSELDSTVAERDTTAIDLGVKPIVEDEASDDEPIGKSYSDTDMEGSDGEDQDCNSENTESENEDLCADFGNCIDLSKEHKVLSYMSDFESDDEDRNDMFVDDDMCEVDFRMGVEESIRHEKDSDGFVETNEEMEQSFRELEIYENVCKINADDTEVDLNETVSAERCMNSHDVPTVPSDVPVMEEVSTKWHLPEGYFQGYIDLEENDVELGHIKERKFICSLDQLHMLMKNITCTECSSTVEITKEKFIGSVVEVTYKCSKGHCRKWASSPMLNKVYTTNFQVCCALIMSGGLYVKESLFFKHLSLGIPCESTFYRILKLYIHPTVENWWMKMQQQMFTIAEGHELIIAGDGRNDSPGHSSTYCTYSFLDTESNLILHQELVDVREAELKSPNMEKIGFQRGLDYLIEKSDIGGVVTDAHTQIGALLAKEMKYVEYFENKEGHQKDIWHKSAKITKKLSAEANLKDNEAIRRWIPSIRNHFWHCAQTCNGDETVMKEKWINLLKHVCDVHEWHGGECEHGQLDDSSVEKMDPESVAFTSLTDIVLDKKLLGSFRYYKKFRHTGILEVYHSHYGMYSPKRVFFNVFYRNRTERELNILELCHSRYQSQKVRMRLSAIDHNHHVNLSVATDKDGKPKHTRRWSKKAGRWISVKLKVKKDYSYAPYLMAAILHERNIDPLPMKRKIPKDPKDPTSIAPSIAKLPAPNTKELANKQLDRFGSGKK